MFLDEALAAARHDLGKYVHFEARWIAEDADATSVREALRADLLRTRRGPRGEHGVGKVWADARAEIALAMACDGRPLDLADIDRRVVELAAAAERLDDLSLPELRDVAALARSLAEAIRALG